MKNPLRFGWKEVGEMWWLGAILLIICGSVVYISKLPAMSAAPEHVIRTEHIEEFTKQKENVMVKQGDELVQVEGQRVINAGSGAKEHNEFEAVYAQTGDAGAASLPKVEAGYCNSPKGQETK